MLYDTQRTEPGAHPMIENEIKFVLTGYDELERLLTGMYAWHDIEQGYLTNNNRIREITHQNRQVEHVFSFKKRLQNGRNVEIESDEMTKDDFDDLWKDTTERCWKRRFSVFETHVNPKAIVRWDIDFPRWPSGNKYFAMAEVEMPASMEHIEEILPIIKSNIFHMVPRTDNRFSARRLSSDEHTQKMAEELGLWPAK